MVTYLLKKSYLLKDLKQIEFQDLWGGHGIFTTMWIFGKPPKILFFDNHLKNLISSLKKYRIKKKFLKKDILKIINKNLSKMDNSQSDIGLVFNKRLLETGTSNLLFVKDQKFFTPRKGYYEGNTYKFFKTKIKKIIKKDIFLKEINSYDEILLLGSGKGVTSVKTINEIKWKRKNLDKFRFLSKHYNTAINKCNSYRF